MTPSFLEPYRQALRQEMEACFPPFPVLELARYQLGWDGGGEGKLLRPMLCLAACRAVGGEGEQALPAAAAVELVHNFSLIHDDIQDASPLRRRRPTVWKVWGEAQAINAGDALFAAARLCLLRLRERGVSPSRVVAACQMLDEACLRLCHGQFLDLAYESRPTVSLEDYTLMARHKTSALMEASLNLGGLAGGAGKGVLGALGRCGSALGLAFQVQDDVLGLWGDPEVTGKEAQDLLRKKKTFPLVYALERARGEVRPFLLRLLAKPALEPADVAAMREVLDRAGTREGALQAAQEYYSRALRELAGLKGGGGELKALIISLKERER